VETIVFILIALAVVGFVAFKNKDKLLGLVKKKADAPQPVSQPAVTGASAPGAEAPAVDYPYWAQWTRYDLETLQFNLRGGRPAGWDWRKHEAARGDPDGRTHSNSGASIEVQEGRSYKPEIVFKGSYGDDLLLVPGRLVVQGAPGPVRVTWRHGAQSKGRVMASVNGAAHEELTHFDLGAGDSVVHFDGEPEALRIAVGMRLAP
jgi:hypothetical protein